MADLTQFFFHSQFKSNVHLLIIDSSTVGKIETLIFKPLHIKALIINLNLPPIQYDSFSSSNLKIEDKIVEIIMPNKDKSGTCTVIFNKIRVPNVSYEVFYNRELSMNINSHDISISLSLAILQKYWTNIEFKIINKKNEEENRYNVVIKESIH